MPVRIRVDHKVPVTVLAVSDDGWLVASENRMAASAEQCKFYDTLFLD
jgi:hypothetical protein